MDRGARRWLVAGGINMLLAVALGAFGAHALRGRVDARMLDVWHTASQYHVWHALGLLGIGALLRGGHGARMLHASAGAMLAGIALFCGSLYLLAVTGAGWLGAITPFGGVSFLLAWGLFVAAVARAR